jgi:hypothetical protein
MADVCDDDGVSGESLRQKGAQAPFCFLFVSLIDIPTPMQFNSLLLTLKELLYLFLKTIGFMHYDVVGRPEIPGSFNP